MQTSLSLFLSKCVTCCIGLYLSILPMWWGNVWWQWGYSDFMHHSSIQIWWLTQPRRCQLPCQSSKWIEMFCLRHLKLQTAIWSPYFIPHTSISPPHQKPNKQEKNSAPFPGSFISLNCTIIRLVAYGKNLTAYFPFIPLFLTPHFQPISKSHNSIFKTHPKYIYISPSPLFPLQSKPLHVSHGTLQSLPVSSSQSSMFFNVK